MCTHFSELSISLENRGFVSSLQPHKPNGEKKAVPDSLCPNAHTRTHEMSGQGEGIISKGERTEEENFVRSLRLLLRKTLAIQLFVDGIRDSFRLLFGKDTNLSVGRGLVQWRRDSPCQWVVVCRESGEP